MSTISLCNKYRTLLLVLRQSQWHSTSATFPSFRGFESSRRPSSSINEWISKPFPGFWTCKRGFILWRPPIHATAARTNIRIFCLLSIDDIVLGNLTRFYWHALCGPSLLPQQCQGSNLPEAITRRTECRNCRDTTLRLSNLKGNHKILLRLLIDRPWVTGNSNLNLVLRSLQTLKSTRVQCWNSRIERIAIPSGSHVRKEIECQRSKDVVGNEPIQLLDGANQTFTTVNSGVASGKLDFFYPWVMVISTMRAMILNGLRVVGLCEPLLEEGKSRVRWKCVSTLEGWTPNHLCIDPIQQCCGRSLIDDFIERRPGAARDLEKWLNKSAAAGSGSGSGQGQRSATTLPARIESSIIVTGSPQPWSVDTSLEAPTRVFEPSPRRRIDDSIFINGDPESHWLLVCARSQGRPTSLTQLDLCRTSSDKELFQELKLTYMSLKSKWARLFSFKKVQSIRFVQVCKPSRDLGTCLKRVSLMWRGSLSCTSKIS